ncbi:hypothetical protein N6H14_26720 [Paenibacillus sp. CC-CFT747]|nr:hypothetical protein N6H14_26720 [Paenibacillus sp. CC-CFT747]
MDASLAAVWDAANREGVRRLNGHPALDIPIRILDATVTPDLAVPYETVSLEEVSEHKSEYVYFFKFPSLALFIELETLGDAQGRSMFIQSDYSVKIDSPAISKFLNAFGIAGHSLSNGGHAHPEALADLIERIAPKTVITLHSKFPESQNTKESPLTSRRKGKPSRFLPS